MELPPFGTPQPDSTRQGPIVATTLVSILAVVLAGAFAPVLFVFGLVLQRQIYDRLGHQEVAYGNAVQCYE